MMKYSYINESGLECYAEIHDTFPVKDGLGKVVRIANGEKYQKKFNKLLKNCKKVRQIYVHGD